MTGVAHLNLKKEEASKTLSTWRNNKNNPYKKKIEEIMELWDRFAKEYRERPEEYEYYLLKKREAGFKKLDNLKGNYKKEYPKVEIFDEEDREKVRRKLERMDYTKLTKTHQEAYWVQYNAVFRSMKIFIDNTKFELQNGKKCVIAPNPDRLHTNICSKYHNYIRN